MDENINEVVEVTPEAVSEQEVVTEVVTEEKIEAVPEVALS